MGAVVIREVWLRDVCEEALTNSFGRLPSWSGEGMRWTEWRKLGDKGVTGLVGAMPGRMTRDVWKGRQTVI
jgi:hypothetical protein